MSSPLARRVLRLALVLAAVAGSVGLYIGPTHAACAAPRLTWQGTLHPGGEIVITGENFFVGCDDTGRSQVGGCGAPWISDASTVRPTSNIEVTLTQDGERRLIGVVDADKHHNFRLEATLPRDISLGAAVLHAEGDGGGDATAEVMISTSESSKPAG